MNFACAVAPLLAGRDLLPNDAEALMDWLIGGEATPAQIGASLTALAVKGASGNELAAFARVLKRYVVPLKHGYSDLVDTCGTGGGSPSFNISTAAAIVASAAGARIAKHGNRGVTSKCGSVDVLESLGLRIDLSPSRQVQLLDSIGCAFLFAQAHHPALRHVGPARRELGFRTVFNQLGPLNNPAGATRQLIGVYDAALMLPMAEALVELGCERAVIVRGEDGLDEISPSGPTRALFVLDGQIRERSLIPRDFGIDNVSPSSLTPGDGPTDNAAILIEAISDPESPRCRAVVPSASAALWLGGIESDLAVGAARAIDAVRSGAARKKLDDLIRDTNDVSAETA